MRGSSLSANSNVTIYVKDQYNKIIRKSQIHNKASIVLAEGLLRFLEGDFTPSKISSGININYDSNEALRYLPYEIRVGTIGVDTTGRDSQDRPVLVNINSSVFKIPTFNETKLQEEIIVLNPEYRDIWDQNTITFNSVDLTSYGDTNNSMGLILHAFIPAGSLVGFKDAQSPDDPPVFVPYTNDIVAPSGQSGYGWAYWNQSSGKVDSHGNPEGEWEALFTEIGLYSSSGEILARVLLDGALNLVVEDNEIKSLEYTNPDYGCNPIIQSETSSIIIEWRIGLISIGDNDKVYGVANLKDGAEVTFYNSDGTESFIKYATLAGELRFPTITYVPPETGQVAYGWRDSVSGDIYPEGAIIQGITEPKNYIAVFGEPQDIEEQIYASILNDTWGSD